RHCLEVLPRCALHASARLPLDPARPPTSTLSLHDALPILPSAGVAVVCTWSIQLKVVRTAWVTGRRLSVTMGTLVWRRTTPTSFNARMIALEPAQRPVLAVAVSAPLTGLPSAPGPAAAAAARAAA